MITEDDIELKVYYGDEAQRCRVMAWSWNDGRNGVNYSVENVRSFMPMYCSKADFVKMANEGGRFL